MHKTGATIALLLLAAPAVAHHKQTPPIVQFSTDGDSALRRVAATGSVLTFRTPALGTPQIVRFDVGTLTSHQVTIAGDNQNPSTSRTGLVVAWDSDEDFTSSGDPGRQIFQMNKGKISQVLHDPTGTSTNPAVSAGGTRIAFESTGDLANTGNAGYRQVFLVDQRGIVKQLSQGQGTSRNPGIGRGGRTVVFDSTSDPDDGHDTGIPQLWVSIPDAGIAKRVTNGAVPSRNAAISLEGRLVAFESDADLGDTGADMGVTQVFVYDVITDTFAQISNDPAGCTNPSTNKYGAEWRVAFSCGESGHSRGYYYEIRADQLYRVPIDFGDTAQVAQEGGHHFVTVSTTADLVAGSGTTSGHELYLLNLFKRPGLPVSGQAVWFPFRGIPAGK
jgi:Tol biopolymer transport system component